MRKNTLPTVLGAWAAAPLDAFFPLRGSAALRDACAGRTVHCPAPVAAAVVAGDACAVLRAAAEERLPSGLGSAVFGGKSLALFNRSGFQYASTAATCALLRARACVSTYVGARAPAETGVAPAAEAPVKADRASTPVAVKPP